MDPMDAYDSEYYGENGQQKNKPGSDSSFDYVDHGGTLCLCMNNLLLISYHFFKSLALLEFESKLPLRF